MAAILFTIITALLTVFQVALASGVPLGAYAWGGRDSGVLPKRQRIGSAVAVVIYLAFVLIVLSRAGIIDFLPDWFTVPATWVIFAYLLLGSAMNAISRSVKERAVMAPVTAVLAILVLLVALG